MSEYWSGYVKLFIDIVLIHALAPAHDAKYSYLWFNPQTLGDRHHQYHSKIYTTAFL